MLLLTRIQYQVFMRLSNTRRDFSTLKIKGAETRQQDSVVQEIPAIPKAILVDLINVTGKKTIRLKKRISRIGRGSGNEVEIQKERISGLHAVIEYRDGLLFLEDQRSKNKTTLGGVELEPHAPATLKSGDGIVFD